MKPSKRIKRPLNPMLEDLILESNQSELLQSFLACNPHRLDKLRRMSVINAAEEIGSIEARLSLPRSR
jgi:hypothetical protein